MKVYAVHKEGVYRHECLGVYSTLAGAEARANEVAALEEDDYHAFSIYEYELDAADDDSTVERTAALSVQAKGPTPAHRQTHKEGFPCGAPGGRVSYGGREPVTCQKCKERP